jgi:hypothetical protein
VPIPIAVHEANKKDPSPTLPTRGRKHLECFMLAQNAADSLPLMKRVGEGFLSRIKTFAPCTMGLQAKTMLYMIIMQIKRSILRAACA